MSELSRPIRLDALGALPRELVIAANDGERAALAERFGLIALGALEARLILSEDDHGLRAKGQMTAQLVQACAATGEPVPGTINEDINLIFVPPAPLGEDDIELSSDDCDTIEHDSQQIDPGEAVAQSLGLAIDPFVRAPGAEERLRQAGVVSEVGRANPFAVLKS